MVNWGIGNGRENNLNQISFVTKNGTNRFFSQNQDFKPEESCFITTEVCIPS